MWPSLAGTNFALTSALCAVNDIRKLAPNGVVGSYPVIPVRLRATCTKRGCAAAKKPIRIWMEVSDRTSSTRPLITGNMHDWVVVNENMAKALVAKRYHYQFVFPATPTGSGIPMATLPAS
jgi:hypothetical protein